MGGDHRQEDLIMLNKAMNTMEQLRKAEELRISLINEAREALVILGAETQAENIQPITINKGKIVEVKTTDVKEVVIDNTGKTRGRGAYVVKKKSAIMQAQKKKVLAKHLEVEIPDSLFEELLNKLGDKVDQ